MKCAIRQGLTVFLFIGTFVGSAKAAQVSGSRPLEGIWTMERQECQSGAPYKTSEGLQMSLNGRLVVSETRLRLSMKIGFKYEQAYAEDLMKQIQSAKDQWSDLPDSAEKRESLAELNESLRTIETYASGVQCRMSELRSYKTNGSTLSSTSIRSSSNCPGAQVTPVGQTDNSAFEIKGDLLKVTSSEAETDSSSCPKGEKVVMVFKRIP